MKEIELYTENELVELNEYTENELVELKNLIDKRIELIKNNKVNINKTSKKTKLSDLKSDDMIIGIGLSSKIGHKLISEQPIDAWEVDIVDYCIVEGISKRKDGLYNISFSHPREPFGCSTTIDGNNHCFLSMRTFLSGYEQFYTLKPKTWKEDLIIELDDLIKRKRKYFEEDINILKTKVDKWISYEEFINNKLKDYNLIK